MTPSLIPIMPIFYRKADRNIGAPAHQVIKGTPISRSQVKVKSHHALQFSTAGFALLLNLIG
jgi:hypothetical protein